MKKLLLFVLISASISTFAQQTDEAYIKKESTGGKLDFAKRIEEKYRTETSIPFGNQSFSKKDYAILLWAANVRTLGIESFDQIVKIWEKTYKRSLTKSETKALKTGFEAKF